MAGGLLNLVGLVSFSPFSTCHILAINYKIYISKIMKVVREKLIECSILVKELFENTEDALTETKEGKIISVDMPGFEGEVSEDTAKTFMDHTGKSWNWVVVLFGVSLLILSICFDDVVFQSITIPRLTSNKSIEPDKPERMVTRCSTSYPSILPKTSAK